MSRAQSDSNFSDDEVSVIDEPLPYDPAQFTDYFINKLTEEEETAMEEAREPALSDPLKRGLLIPWVGPNRHPETLPSTDYPPATTPDPSAHAPRPQLARLLSPDAPAHGAHGWILRLVEAVQAGPAQWSQVWRCKVADGAGKELDETVVLKLYQQSLFPLPNPEGSSPEYDAWNWYPASHLESREAEAYSLLQVYQGRDIPLCYGFYRFRLPCGEDAVGVVLEDLLDVTEPLAELVLREDYHKRFTLESLDSLVTACFDAQYRFQNCKIQRTVSSRHNILVRKHSWPLQPLLVIVGFSKCRNADFDRQIAELYLQRYYLRERFIPPQPYRPRERDQTLLWVMWEDIIDNSPVRYRDWREMEKRRKKLLYLGQLHGGGRRDQWAKELEQWERERARERGPQGPE